MKTSLEGDRAREEIDEEDVPSERGSLQYQEMASPQGISDGYAPLIEILANELSDLADRAVELAAISLATLLPSTATCAACRLLRETATEQIERLFTQLTTAAGREAYISSAGLCLPHLQETLASLEHRADQIIGRRRIAEFLSREQVRQLEHLAEDLRSYVLKRDALRRGLLYREEEDAWRRALVQLVGERAARGGAMMADQRTV